MTRECVVRSPHREEQDARPSGLSDFKAAESVEKKESAENAPDTGSGAGSPSGSL